VGTILCDNGEVDLFHVSLCTRLADVKPIHAPGEMTQEDANKWVLEQHLLFSDAEAHDLVYFLRDVQMHPQGYTPDTLTKEMFAR